MSSSETADQLSVTRQAEPDSQPGIQAFRHPRRGGGHRRLSSERMHFYPGCASFNSSRNPSAPARARSVSPLPRCPRLHPPPIAIVRVQFKFLRVAWCVNRRQGARSFGNFPPVVLLVEAAIGCRWSTNRDHGMSPLRSPPPTTR